MNFFMVRETQNLTTPKDVLQSITDYEKYINNRKFTVYYFTINLSKFNLINTLTETEFLKNQYLKFTPLFHLF